MKDRKYFTINETNARASHEMMSMSDYSDGNTTKEYRDSVDQAYNLADKVAEKRPDEADRAYELAEKYARQMASYYNRESSIGMICPSVLISGPSNFPVNKKKKQIAAWDKNHQYYEDTQKILEKIENILYGREIIKSNDERAIEKLEEKLNDLKESQEYMKSVNKALRLKDTEAGNDALRELGLSEEQIKTVREPHYGIIGFASWQLQNNNANIHRIEERIASLKATKERGTSEQEYDTFKVVENTEAMRYQIIFDDKPDEEVRNILKSNGFKWAPSQGAWQRQITANGKYALNIVIQRLNELEQNDNE